MISMEALHLLSMILAAALAFLIHAAKKPRRHTHAPPTVPGWPLLGNTVSLGLHGASFIHDCRASHGDAFTLDLAGRRMTFLFHPDALAAFFTAPDKDIAFRYAARPPTSTADPPACFSDVLDATHLCVEVDRVVLLVPGVPLQDGCERWQSVSTESAGLRKHKNCWCCKSRA